MTSYSGVSLAAGVTELPSAAFFPATGGTISGPLTVTGAFAAQSTASFGAAVSFASTVTFADGAVWSLTGLSATNTYSTATNAPIFIAPTLSYTSTAAAGYGVYIAPVMQPTGAGTGNTQGIQFVPGIGTSTNTFPIFRGLNLGGTVSSGYTGSITQWDTLFITQPTNTSTGFPTTLNVIDVGAVTSANGATSGSYTNNGISIAANTAAAGSTATVFNNAAKLNLPSGSSAGTTNKGIYLTGNGGALSVNYSLYSDSTAPSQLFGGLTIGSAQIATTATTNNFLWMYSCAGAPTGIPAQPFSGAVALQFDNTNKKLYVCTASVWYNILLATV